MKKKFLLLCITALLLSNLFPALVQADMGPKPSVTLFFDGLEETKTYYVTLLSQEEQIGPWSAGDNGKEDEISRFFSEYEDADGFYYLNYHEQVKDNEFSWTYYPPNVFKIAVYCPEDSSFLVSEIIEKEAFEAYYRVSYSSSVLEVKEESHMERDLLHGLLRAFITIVVELALAVLFGYREKKQILIILFTNLFTQVVLNLFLSLTNYYMGLLAWVMMFFVGELAVLAIEELIYMLSFRKVKKGKLFLYALLANFLSALLSFYSALSYFIE